MDPDLQFERERLDSVIATVNAHDERLKGLVPSDEAVDLGPLMDWVGQLRTRLERLEQREGAPAMERLDALEANAEFVPLLSSEIRTLSTKLDQIDGRLTVHARLIDAFPEYANHHQHRDYADRTHPHPDLEHAIALAGGRISDLQKSQAALDTKQAADRIQNIKQYSTLSQDLDTHTHDDRYAPEDHPHGDLEEAITLLTGVVQRLTERLAALDEAIMAEPPSRQSEIDRLDGRINRLLDAMGSHDHGDAYAHPEHTHELALDDDLTTVGMRHVHRWRRRLGGDPTVRVYDCVVPGCAAKMSMED